MLYLLLAITCSSLISIFMRISGRYVKGDISLLAVNYVVCLCLGISFASVSAIFPQAEGVGRTFGMGLINGVLYLSNFVLLQWNIRKNGVVLPGIFARLGLLVPMVLSLFVFGEMLQSLQLTGFLLALASIILINFEKESTAVESKAGLFFLLFLSGTTDSMAKIYEEVGNSELSAQFLLYTFAAALILCFGLMLIQKQRIGKMELLWGILIGVPNFFSAKFMLRSLQDLPAVIVYPTYSVGTIVVITLAGVLLFKEKLGKRQKIAMAGIVVALALLNM